MCVLLLFYSSAHLRHLHSFPTRRSSDLYTTRVGGGPFPTELTDALGDRLRADGDEYGATTGRPRRCGWFDAVVVRQAAALSGVDGLAVTKPDVLTGIAPPRVCTAHELGGRRLELPPATERAWARVVPHYEEL